MNGNRRGSRAVAPSVGLSLVLVCLAALVPTAQAGAPAPETPFSIPGGAYQATFIEDTNLITHMEFVGDYNKSLPDGSFNLPARAVVAQEFYRTHPDEYDFLVTFTTFEFETGDAIAFHQGARNDVEGIGLPLFDNSAAYGSDGVLRGFIEMAATSRYELNPLAPGYEFVLATLAHETLHNWGTFVQYEDSTGQASDRLLGRDGAHWNYFLDSDASVEYGARWQDNGDGTFTSLDVRRFFSPLDLYLMGLVAPEEVPDTLLIDSTDADPTDVPVQGVTVSGTSELISIDDIIAVEGPRVPAAGDAPDELRYAFIVLTPPGEEPSPALLARLASVRRDYATRFAIMTGGRGRAAIFPKTLPAADVGVQDFVTGGALRGTGANVQDGLGWLAGEQAADGSWSDREGTAVRDTTEVFRVLSELDPLSPQLAAARGFLLSQTGLNTDSLSRMIRVLKEVAGAERIDELLARQNDDGGWGLNPGDRSDALDTALAVLALSAVEEVGGATADGLAFLADLQNPDGGWPAGEQGPSNVLATTQALIALSELAGDGAVLESGILYLLSSQGGDGGFGAVGSSVHETSLALATLIALDRADDADLTGARDFVDSRQAVEGSWAGSGYTTALAILALQSIDFPNWRIESIEADATTLVDGERTDVRVLVVNDGKDPLPAGTLEVYDGDPQAGGVLLETLLLPELAPLQGVTSTFTFDSFDLPGAHVLTAVVDPGGLVAERSEGDNIALVSVQVDPAPAGIDLEFTSSDLAIVPQNPFTLPTTLGVSANVRNLGDTNASDVLIQLWRGPPGESGSELLDASTVAVLSRTNTLVNFSYSLDVPGTSTFFVVADPANTIAEVREDNNETSDSVTTQDSVDLSIEGAGVVVTPSPGLFGQDITFEVPVSNRGTTAAAPSQVRYSVSDGGGFFQELDIVDVSLEAGETVVHTVVWRVDQIGSFTLSGEIDFADVIPELSEANNIAVVPFTTQAQTGSNLSTDFRDVSFSPNPALEGAGLTLSTVVTNSGTVAAAGVVVAFFDGDPDAGGVEIGRTTIPNIDAGTSAPVSFVWSAVSSSADRVIHFVVDPDNAVSEFDEADNRVFESIEVEALPDLVISSSGVRPDPAFPREGDPITITIEVQNLGAQAATGVVVRVFDGDPAAGGVLIGNTSIGVIAPFTTGVTSVGHTLPVGVESQAITVQVDPDGTIFEGNETNNQASRTVAIQTGDTFVTNPFISPNGDGVQEETDFFFALEASLDVTVVVVDPNEAVIRTGAAFAGPIDEGQFTWDGRNDAGQVVADGAYRIEARNVLDQALAQATVVVDNNRSPVLDAVGTPFGVQTDLTAQLGEFYTEFVNDRVTPVLFSPNDEFIFLNIGYYNNSPLPKGVYRASPSGAGAVRILEDDGGLLGTGFQLFDISPDGELILFASNSPNMLVANIDGTNLRELPGADNCCDTELRRFLDSDRIIYVVAGDRFSPSEIYVAPIDGISTPTLVASLPPGELGELDALHVSDGLALIESHPRGGSFFDPTDPDAPSSVSSLHFVDVAAGTATRIGDGGQFSPDGSRIAVVQAIAGDFQVMDRDGIILETIPLPFSIPPSNDPYLPESGRVVQTEWSQDGRYVAFDFWPFEASSFCFGQHSGNPGGLVMVDLADGSATQKTRVSERAECEVPFSFHISAPLAAGFEEVGALHFGLTPDEQGLALGEARTSDGEMVVRIEQVGHEEAEIDAIHLVDESGKRYSPVFVRNVTRGGDLLEEVLAADHFVASSHEQTLELSFRGLNADSRYALVMTAREATLSNRRVRPFAYPDLGDSFSIVLDSAGALGVLPEGSASAQPAIEAPARKPLFSSLSQPDTGHPTAAVRGWVSNDASRLYAALDFAVDNNAEGVGDWATFQIRTDPEASWQSHRVTLSESEYGDVGFGYTDAASYPHKVYEFDLALADLGVAPGDEIEVRFEAYGSAGYFDPLNPVALVPFAYEAGVPATGFVGAGVEPSVQPQVEAGLSWSGNDLVYRTTILLDEEAWDIASQLDNDHDDRRPSVSGTRVRPQGDPTYASVLPEQAPNFMQSSPAGSALMFQTRIVDQQTVNFPHTIIFQSLLNLTADLRVRRSSSEPGVLVEGTASDQNLGTWVLEYRETADGSPWMPVTSPSDQSVVDGRLATWVPPSIGSFFVRLTVTDLAGNERIQIQRVSWSDRTPITDLQTSSGQISPNGDGALDDVTLQFRVLEPTNLEFEVVDEDGLSIRTLTGSFSTIGSTGTFVWDGRDADGLLVDDGEYTLVIDGFQFFVTVDAMAPTVSETPVPLVGYVDEEGAACSPTVNFECTLALRPDFQANVLDQNLDEIFVESKLRTEGTWSADDTTQVRRLTQENGAIDLTVTPLPGVDSLDVLATSTAFGDQVGRLADRDYRLRVVDLAGNETILVFGPASKREQVVVTFNGPQQSLFSADLVTNPAEFEPSQIRYPISSSFIPSRPLREVRFSVVETLTEEIQDVFLEFRPTGTQDWSSTLQTDFVGVTENVNEELVSGILSGRNEHYFHALVDPSAFGSEAHDFRMRIVDTLGAETFSNEFNLKFADSFTVIVNGDSDSISADETPIAVDYDTNYDITSLSLYVSSDDDPAYNPEVLVQVLTPAQEPMLAERSAMVNLDAIPLRACTTYEVRAVLEGANGESTSTSQSVSFACFEVRVLSMDPVSPETCGDGPTDGILFELGVVNENREAFELTQLALGIDQGAGPLDVLFNVVQPNSGSSDAPFEYAYVLDTSSYPAGRVLPIRVELTNDVGRVVSATRNVAIDHRAPEVEITSPLEGQVVCADQLTKAAEVFGDPRVTTRGVEIQARVDDDHSGASYPLLTSYVSRTVQEGLSSTASRYEIDDPEAAERDFVRVSTGESLTPRGRRRSLDQTSIIASGRQYVLETPESGEYSVRFEVLDQGTHLVCQDRTFIVDAEVDGASANVLSGRYLSPNGDGDRDLLELSFNTGEPVDVTVEVIPARMAASGELTNQGLVARSPNGENFVPAGGTLTTIVDGLQALPGETQIDWDGLDQGGAAVPDGDYLIVITGRDGCLNTFEQVFYVQLDTQAPTVSILAPLPLDPIGVVAEIVGTADDMSLLNYTLSLSTVLAPDAIQVLATGDMAVVSEALGVWNTFGLVGDYQLNLTARDLAGNEATVSVPYNLGVREDLLSDFALLGEFVSPNNDGRRELLPVRFTATSPVNVTLEVLNGSGTVLRTLVGGAAYEPGSHTVNWDARDDLAAVLPDGNAYDIRITAALIANPLLTQTEVLGAVVDATEPAVSITEVEGGFLQASGVPEVSISDPNLTMYEVEITPEGGAPISLLTGSTSISNVPVALTSTEDFPDGEYVLRATAEDAGESRTLVEIALTIDREAPVVALDEPIASAAFQPDATPRAAIGVVEDSNLALYELILRPQAGPDIVLFSANQPPATEEIATYQLGGQVDGNYTLVLRATDASGNESSTSRPFFVDGTAPTVALTNPIDGAFIGIDVPIQGQVSDETPGEYELLYSPASVNDVDQATSLVINGGERTGTLYTWRDQPVDGAYRLYLRATDRADNSALVSIQVELDSTPPDTPTIESAEFDPSQNVSLSWTASAASDLVGYHVERDGVRVTASPVAATTFLDPSVEEGDHSYVVLSVDVAGNESAPSEASMLRVDVTPPDASLSAPGTGALVSGAVDVRGTANSSDDFAAYRVLGGSGAAPSTFDSLGSGSLPVSGELLAQWDTTSAPDGLFTIRLEAEDQSGNIGQAEVAVTIDNTPPLAPSNLQGSLTDDDATLTWDASPSTDLAGYLLFRNDRLANLDGPLVGSPLPHALAVTNFDDLDLADGTYEFTAFAIDLAGNVSDPSAAFEIVVERSAPHVEFIEPESGDYFDEFLQLHAEGIDEDIALVVFEARESGTADPWFELARDDIEPFRIIADTEALDFVEFEIRAIATDAAGNSDPAPPIVFAEHSDLDEPEPPSDVVAVVNGDTVTITWTGSPAADLDRYHIVRSDPTDPDPFDTAENGFDLDNSADELATTFVDDTIPADGLYQYAVYAADTSDNFSEDAFSEFVPVFTVRVETPETPTSDSEVSLSFVSPETGDLEIEVVAPSGTTSLPTSAVESEIAFDVLALPLEIGSNTVRAQVVNLDGHRSRLSEFTVVRADAPSAPTGVSTSVAGTDVTVIWNANPEPNILGYEVFRDGESLADESLEMFTGTTLGTTLGVDANPNTCQQMSFGEALTAPMDFVLGSPQLVSGIEFRQGNSNFFTPRNFDVSVWAGDAWLKVAEVRNAAPDSAALPTHLFSAEFPAHVTDQIRFDVLEISTSYRAPGAQYRFNVCDVQAVVPVLETGTNFVDIAVPDGLRDYTVRAWDDLGLVSADSATSTAGVGDITPPDAVVLIGSVTGSTVSLTWAESAANDTGVYTIFRDAVEIGSLLDDGSGSYAFDDVDRTNGSYAYHVVATDLLGNASVSSNVLNLVVSEPDPLTPENLMGVSATSGKTVTLSWQAAAGSMPAQYVILRSVDGGAFEELTAVVGTTFVDRTVEHGKTYRYVVRAVDTIGNESPDSMDVTLTVIDSQLPDRPFLSNPASPFWLHRTGNEFVDLQGISEPGAQVFLLDEEGGFATTTASSDIVERHLPTIPAGRVYLQRIMSRHRDDWVFKRSSDFNEFDIYDSVLDELVAEGFPSVQGSNLAPDERNGYVYVSDGTGIVRLDVATGLSEPVELSVVPNSVSGIGISTSGNELVIVMASSGPPEIWVHDLTTGVTDFIVSANVGVTTIAISPDVRWLGWAQSNQRFVYDRDTDQLIELEPSTQGGGHMGWSPDSKQLIHSTYTGTDYDIWIFDTETGLDSPLITDTGNQRFPVWSPDGKSIAWVIERGFAIGDAVVVKAMPDGVPEIIYETEKDLVDAAWTRSNRLRFTERTGSNAYRDMVVFDMPGIFEVQNVELSPGENRFRTAAIDTAGNEGEISTDEAMIIQGAIGGADLRPEIMIEPGLPHVLSGAEVQVRVYNQGSVDAEAVEVDLFLIEPDGAESALTIGALLPLVPAGGFADVLVGWTPSEAGNHRLVAQADPRGLIADANTVNNRSIVPVIVSADASPTLTIESLALEIEGSSDLGGEVQILNAGRRFVGVAEISVEDLSGARVALVESLPVDLAPNESIGFTTIWNSGNTFAGQYRLVGRLRDATADLVSSGDSAFLILADEVLGVDFVTDRDRYEANQDVRVVGTATRFGGNTILSDMRAVVEIVRGGSVVFSSESLVGTLLPGSQVGFDLTWNTGSSPTDFYAVNVELQDSLGTVFASATDLLEIVSGDAELAGSLVLATTAVPQGNSVQVNYGIENVGNAPVTGATVIVALRDGESLAELDAVVVTGVDLAIGESLPGSADFPTATQPIGEYQVELRVEVPIPGDTLRQRLATTPVQIIDVTPPTLVVNSPSEGATVNSTRTFVRVSAVDFGVGVARVEASVDGGAFQVLTLGSTGFELSLAGLVEGPHSIALRAIDIAGNTSFSLTRNFIVDDTPPTITLSGVSDGLISNVAVTPIVTVDDVSATGLTLLLNGVAFTSGTPITLDGNYSLSIVASDAAGNIASQQLEFLIDTTAPDAPIVTSHADGEVLAGDTITLLGDAEPGTTVQLTVNGVAVAPATVDELGGFSFPDVVLDSGANSLVLETVDAAGNTSPSTNLTLTVGAANQGTILSGRFAVRPGEGLAATFDLEIGFRHDGYVECVSPLTGTVDTCTGAGGLPGVGDLIAETIGGMRLDPGDGATPIGSAFNLGNGQPGPLVFEVVTVNPDEVRMSARAIDFDSLPAIVQGVPYSYPLAGVYAPSTVGGIRLSGVADAAYDGVRELMNAPAVGFRLEATFEAAGPGAPPILGAPSVIRCPVDALCVLPIKAVDVDGDVLSYRLATAIEAAAPGEQLVQPGPPLAPNALSVDASTGLVTWDSTGAARTLQPGGLTYYAVQIVAEDGARKSSVEVLIELVPADVTDPTLVVLRDGLDVCGDTIELEEGELLSLDLQAADADAGDLLTLSSGGLPLGSSTTPSLPLSGNPALASFDWTPDVPGRAEVMVFDVASDGGGAAVCSVAVRVNGVEAPTCEPREDWAPRFCWGSFDAYSEADLDAYAASDFGRYSGPFYRNLRIRGDITATEIDVQSPCRITVWQGRKLTADLVRLDARYGVSNYSGWDLEAESACLLSSHGTAGFGALSTINAGDLRIESRFNSSIGWGSNVTIDRKLEMEATSSYFGSAWILHGTQVTAESVSLESLSRSSIGNGASIVATGEVSLNAAKGIASLGRNSSVDATSLSVTSGKTVRVGRSANVTTSGDIDIVANSASGQSFTTVDLNATLSTPAKMTIGSQSFTRVRSGADLTAGPLMTLDAVSSSACQISSSANLAADAFAGKCAP